MSVETGLQFVDTNVLIYAHDMTAGARHTRAQALLAELWESGNGCLSIQTLQEFYVNITQKAKKQLDVPTATRIVKALGKWTIHRPGVDDVLSAIAIQQRHRIAFWDAMIVNSAARLGCGVLWSEDLTSGQVYDTVQVVNPFV